MGPKCAHCSQIEIHFSYSSRVFIGPLRHRIYIVDQKLLYFSRVELIGGVPYTVQLRNSQPLHITTIPTGDGSAVHGVEHT